MIKPTPRFSPLTARDKAARLAIWLEEHKASDLVILDIAEKNSLTDLVILASAASIRQAQSLADGLLALCREENFEFLHLEGQTTGQWILVDLNDVVVHIFQGPVREVYNLEGLWRDGTVLRDDRPQRAASVSDAPDGSYFQV